MPFGHRGRSVTWFALREYIEKNPDGNEALIAGRILDVIEILRTQPQMGRPGRLAGTRELVAPGTPYIVPCLVRRERLELLSRIRWTPAIATQTLTAV